MSLSLSLSFCVNRPLLVCFNELLTKSVELTCKHTQDFQLLELRGQIQAYFLDGIKLSSLPICEGNLVTFEETQKDVLICN